MSAGRPSPPGSSTPGLIDSGQTAVKVACELGVFRATLYRALEGGKQ
jgi:hypothetical protein